MEREIWVTSRGNDARLLENEIVQLSDEFSKEDVTILTELKESLEYGAIVEDLFIKIGIGVAVGLILRIIDTLRKKREDAKNVNIHIHLEETNITFNLPRDEHKLLDYCKKKK